MSPACHPLTPPALPWQSHPGAGTYCGPTARCTAGLWFCSARRSIVPGEQGEGSGAGEGLARVRAWTRRWCEENDTPPPPPHTCLALGPPPRLYGQGAGSRGLGSHVCAQPWDSFWGTGSHARVCVKGLHGPRLQMHVDEGGSHGPSLQAPVHKEAAHRQEKLQGAGATAMRAHRHTGRCVWHRDHSPGLHGAGMMNRCVGRACTSWGPGVLQEPAPPKPHTCACVCVAQPQLQWLTCPSTRMLESTGTCWSPRDVSNPTGHARAPRECA